MLTRSNAREHHFFVERAQCRTVNAAHDIRATCSWQTGPTAHVESVGVIAKVRCQQFENDATERIEDQVIAVLNTIKRPDQRIELEVKRNEEFDSPIQQFDVWCRLSDNSGVVEEQLLFTTISPAFAIGWFVYVLNVLCGHGAKLTCKKVS